MLITKRTITVYFVRVSPESIVTVEELESKLQAVDQQAAEEHHKQIQLQQQAQQTEAPILKQEVGTRL